MFYDSSSLFKMSSMKYQYYLVSKQVLSKVKIQGRQEIQIAHCSARTTVLNLLGRRVYPIGISKTFQELKAGLVIILLHFALFEMTSTRCD